jgi:hypothetical protein
MSTKTSLLLVALPPEGQEKALVYRNLRAKVANNGSPLGEVSNLPIPQFKVGDKSDTDS